MVAADMVRAKYLWVYFMHFGAHEGSLILKDVFKIPEVETLSLFLSDAQHWFSKNKVGPMLQGFCKSHYGTTRAFLFPADTRFTIKLLQVKVFLSMKTAIQATVQ